jgi:hypothetical protein
VNQPTAERLNYSAPPPGYEWSGGRTYVVEMLAEAIAAAWASHKLHNDPPGVVSSWDDEPGAYLHVDGRCVAALDGGHDPKVVARAAAWAWYDRRLELEPEEGSLLEDHDGAPVPAAPVWPLCLSWPEHQLEAIERWQADSSVKMPAVLLERRMTDGTVEIVEEIRE